MGKGPLVELEDKAIVTDKVESTRVENGKVDKVQIGNDRVKRDRVNPTATPQVRGQAEVSQLRQLVPPNMGRMTKHRRNPSNTRGEASHKTFDDGRNDNDQPQEMIDELELKITTPRILGRARRSTEFYQLGLDYINYTDAGEPSSYEEVIAAPNTATCLQAMNPKWTRFIKIKHGIWSNYQSEGNHYLANGFFGTNM